VLGTAAALIATPAVAQTAAPPAAEATAAANNEGQDSATGSIVITARRTAEKLQRVPASVSAFNARALDRIQAQDTTGLQGAVPNLNIVAGRGSSNATNIFIRGIGQPDALQTFDPAVGVYVDDVYLSRIRGSQLDLLDLDRIEVLRGPQGTLYGKNTIGGRDQSSSPGGPMIRFARMGRSRREATISSKPRLTFGTDFARFRCWRFGPRSRVTGSSKIPPTIANITTKRRLLAGRRLRSIRRKSPRRPNRDYQRDDAHLNVGRPVNNLTTFLVERWS